MRKGILFSLLMIVSILAVACGGGNNASGNGSGGTGCGGDDKGDACGGDDKGGDKADAADAYALYKKEGRKWKHKSVTKMEGMDDMVSFMEYEIKSVADDHAVQVMTMLDKDGKPNEHMKPMETKIEFKVHEATGCAGEAPEIKYETITVEAGEFECMVVEMSGTKSWTSKEFPGLLVKMEGATNSMELIEWSK